MSLRQFRSVAAHLMVLVVGIALVAQPAASDRTDAQVGFTHVRDVAADVDTVGTTLDGGAAVAETRDRRGRTVSRSGVLEATHPFSMVGFRLGDHADEVRFRTVDGNGWTEWTAAPVVHDEGPDAESAGDDTTVDEDAHEGEYTEPVWVGTASQIQFEVVGGDTADVDLTVIDSMGLRLDLARSADDEHELEAVPAAATSPAARPSIVTRAEWGADESWRGDPPEYANTATFAVVHHTAGTNDYSREEAPAIIRGIYYYHTKTRGWSDIGYNFLVDRFGTIYEGRAGGIDRPVIGAHAANYNTGSFGVALMGTYGDVTPSWASQSSLVSLIAWKFDLHWIDPTVAVPRDGVPNAIVGHRDLGQTSCPGGATYGLLGSIRERVEDATSFRGLHTARLTGDWDGDGVETPGWFVQGRWWLRNNHEGDPSTDMVLDYGRAGDVPVVGDWNGDGRDTIGVVRGGDTWILRYEYRSGADIVMKYGRAGDVPVTGDWNGDGRDTIGVVRDGYRFILRYEYRSGADIVLDYGRPGDKPVTGDFNGDGTDTLGVVRGKTFILRYIYRSGADIVLDYGRETDVPLIGDWDGDGTDTLGVERSHRWILRNRYQSPYGDLSYVYRP